MRWVSHKRVAQVTKKGPTGCENEVGLLKQLKIADVLSKSDKGLLLLSSSHTNIHRYFKMNKSGIIYSSSFN